MKLIRVGLGQVVKFGQVLNPNGPIYMQDALHAIGDRYKFTDIPAVLRPDEAAKIGLTFKHGKFTAPEGIVGPIRQNVAAVDELSIYNDGIVINTRISVEAAEAFASDFMTWMGSEYELEYQPAERLPFLFASQIEVQMKPSFLKALDGMNDIFGRIGGLLSGYGLPEYRFEGIGIAANFDIVGIAPPLPGRFALERRVGMSHPTNTFFSVAPLRTKDHLSLLELFESL